MFEGNGDRPRIGLLGSGSAGQLYLRHAQGCSLRYVACADVDAAMAGALAAQHSLPRACTPEELLADPDVQVVINVTPAALHGPTGMAVLRAGKHLFTEKPLARTVDEGRQLLGLAAERGLRVGCAPDTFLGPALQTARHLVDGGAAGPLFAASAVVAATAPEAWHPRPGQFYGEAAGPLYDMGPYYLTALVFLMGPIARVSGFGTVAPRERRVPGTGAAIEPAVPSHEVAVLEFASGALATLATSFDVPAYTVSLQVHGSDGTLALPDPNQGEGAVALLRRGGREWVEQPRSGAGGETRCAGVEDLLAAIAEGRPHRASGELALHVLDAMESIRRAGLTGEVVRLSTTCARPDPLPAPG